MEPPDPSASLEEIQRTRGHAKWYEHSFPQMDSSHCRTLLVYEKKKGMKQKSED